MSSPVAELFTRALGFEDPWQVVSIEFSESNKRLDIHLDFPRGSRFRCPVCGREDATAYDTEEKSWRHLKFFPAPGLPAMPGSPDKLPGLRSETG